LYIIRGEPYRLGSCVHLTADDTVIGRASRNTGPDIVFANQWISRRHVRISRVNGRAYLEDLGSHHGTEINGQKIAKDTPTPLNSSDIVKLARGMVTFHFSYIFDDQTLEFEPITNTMRMSAVQSDFSINWEKRECIVDGKTRVISEKEFAFLQLLHDRANTLVTLDEIKQAVWPERSTTLNGTPDVSLEEINTLVYRIRKKFGRETFLISAVRGNGYIMEWEKDG
jgi:pSer/pThr/pTyr-binding forkhead associated (FHA) protein